MKIYIKNIWKVKKSAIAKRANARYAMLTITIHVLNQPWITQSVMLTLLCKIYFLLVLSESESVSNHDF